MICDRADIVARRGSAEAGEIRGDQAEAIGERRGEQRCEGQAAIREGVQEDQGPAAQRAGHSHEQAVDQRNLHVRPVTPHGIAGRRGAKRQPPRK